MRPENLVLLLWLLAPGVVAAADKLYYFVDEKGVPHYSNVPSDPRYKPLDQSGAVGRAITPSAAPASDFAPPATMPLPPMPAIPPPEPLPPEDIELPTDR